MVFFFFFKNTRGYASFVNTMDYCGFRVNILSLVRLKTIYLDFVENFLLTVGKK